MATTTHEMRDGNLEKKGRRLNLVAYTREGTFEVIAHLSGLTLWSEESFVLHVSGWNCEKKPGFGRILFMRLTSTCCTGPKNDTSHLIAWHGALFHFVLLHPGLLFPHLKNSGQRQHPLGVEISFAFTWSAGCERSMSRSGTVVLLQLPITWIWLAVYPASATSVVSVLLIECDVKCLSFLASFARRKVSSAVVCLKMVWIT